MGSAGRKAVFLSAFVLAAVLLGGSAAGAGSSAVSSPERVEAARFEVEASNGFTAKVDAGAGRVQLTLTRRLKHRREIVQYAAEAEVSTRGVEAELGSLGSIDVSFHPGGVAKGLAPPAGCDGAYVEGETGTFTGVIRFRGENGYARIAADRARGEVGASDRWDCHRTEAAARRGEAREYGHLIAFLPGRRFFRAVGGPETDGRFGPAFFVAATFEHGDSLEIAREVAIEDRRDDFRFDQGLGSAAVRPGAPFAGSGRFRRDAHGTTHWSGSLRVSLPGSPGVSLTGPGFESQLSHDLPGD